MRDPLIDLALMGWRSNQPLDLAHAEQSPRDDAASRYASGWREADTGRRRVASALAGFDLLTTDTDSDGRVAVRAVTTADGAPLLVAGRFLRQSWTADPGRTSEQLAGCGRAAGVHRRADGSYGAHPYGCTSPLCPQCARRKAADRCARIAPVLAHLAARGYQLVHLTLTQPAFADGDTPTHLTEREQRAYEVPTLAGVEPGGAVPGEPLALALERFRSALTALRDGQASRAWWRSTVAGYVYGIEWTGRTRRGGAWLPRWHVHAHLLVILRPGVEVATVDAHGGFELRGPWVDRLVARWATVTTTTDPHTGERVRAVPWAQKVRPLWGGREAVTAAVRECLKYPFKVSALTDAQLTEVLATTKGRRAHMVGGCLHANSRVGRAARELREDGTHGQDLGVADAALAFDLAAAYEAAEDDSPDAPVIYRRAHAGDLNDWRSRVGPDQARWVPLTVAHLVDLYQDDCAVVVVCALALGEPSYDASVLALLRDLVRWRSPP